METFYLALDNYFDNRTLNKRTLTVYVIILLTFNA